MTRIVRTHYRYKRPTRKRKAVPLEVPAVVTISDKTRKRVAKGQPSARPPPEKVSDDTTLNSQRSARANNDRKSAIVIARRPGKRYADVPEVSEEEHRAIGDRADALFREMKRQIAEKVRKP